MASIYHYDNTGKDLFLGGVQVITSVKLDFLGTLLDPSNLTVITEVSMQNAETVQFFMTFDDVISWFYFGKGMGNMSIHGLMLTNERGTPGLPVLLSTTMQTMRGKSVKVSIGNAVFTCVLTNFTVHLTQDPSPIAEFTLSLNIVDHTLPISRPSNTSCVFNPGESPPPPTSPTPSDPFTFIG